MASNPEFLREGTAVQDFLNPDRIVIGCDESDVAVRVSALYKRIQAPLLVTDCASAEMVKYASNTFLATKISFVNAIANLCEALDADVRAVTLGMGYDRRIGFEFLRPGPGYGGSCLPKDTAALIRAAEDVGYDFSLLRGVVAVNETQHERVVTKIRRAAGDLAGARVAVWGLAFKAETNDLRDSPALEVIRRLIKEGALVAAFDPAAGEQAALALTETEIVIPEPEVVIAESATTGTGTVTATVTSRAALPPLREGGVGRRLPRHVRPLRGLPWSHGSRRPHGVGRVPMAKLPESRRIDAQPGSGRRPQHPRSGGAAPLRVRLSGSRTMRAVVTGGAGFLGSHLCRSLLERGWEVLAVDNLSTGRIENIAGLIGEPGFEWVQHDVTRPLEVPGPVDAVLHFASPASPPAYLAMPIETLEVGSTGTRLTLELARLKQARYLLASTSEVYGDPTLHPQPETYWGNVNPVGPRSVYDEAKRYAEAMATAYRRTFAVDVKIVRIFNTYGPGLQAGDGRAIPNFIAQALAGRPITVYGDGSQTRSFCYVDDEVRGLLGLLLSNWAGGPMNIGNPEEHTVLELAERIVHLTGAASSINFSALPENDPARRRPDISLASRELGWKPEIDLDEGLMRTIAWFRENSDD